MLADDPVGGALHGVDVERAMVPADAARIEAGPLGSREQQVAVMPRARCEPRMEIVGDTRAPRAPRPQREAWC